MEMASLPCYALAGFLKGRRHGSEAALKYVVYGAAASGVTLYGLSLLFGMTGETSYAAISKSLVDPAMRVPATFALLMVIAGFAFKTSAVPFQFWAPDVYQGAPTPISGFISTASKAAGFAILLRFTYYAFPVGQTVGAAAWVQLMQPIAILTMLIGNLLALSQKNIKRMLAYSSVAQAGYMFMGVAAFANLQANGADAVASIIFYAATYMLTNICAFTVVGIVSQKVGSDEIKDMNGLFFRAPYLALAMTAAMLSLLGAPPLVGFVGKFFLFRSAIQATEAGVNLYLMIVAGIVLVLVSIVYYLGITYSMYVGKDVNANRKFSMPAASGLVVMLTGFSLIVLTVAVGPFWQIALTAAQSLLKIV
jgi:NADH-quinone oxidoreductase subunit N